MDESQPLGMDWQAIVDGLSTQLSDKNAFLAAAPISPSDKSISVPLSRGDLDLGLSKLYGYGFFGIVAGLLIANEALFGWYLIANRFHVSSVVINVWLSSTIVEVFGVVYLIVKYLFDPAKS